MNSYPSKYDKSCARPVPVILSGMRILYGLLLCAFILMQLGGISANAAKLTAKQILQRASKHYDLVNDYTADAVLTFNSQTMHVPKTKIKIYYKKPDKIHIESKDGLAILPKQGLVVGSPVKDMMSASKLAIAGSERVAGKDCYVISADLEDGARDIQAKAWIDKKDWLVMRMSANPGYGPSVDVVLKYIKVKGKYWMPLDTKAKVSVPPMSRPHGQKNIGKAEPMEATLKFSNYRINTGLKDSIFIEKEKGGR